MRWAIAWMGLACPVANGGGSPDGGGQQCDDRVVATRWIGCLP